MSTSLLYHAFGVRDYRYVKTEYVEGGVIFTMVRKADVCRCSVCGSENVWRQGSVTRPFRTLPIGRKSVTLTQAQTLNTQAQTLKTRKRRHSTFLGIFWPEVMGRRSKGCFSL